MIQFKYLMILMLTWMVPAMSSCAWAQTGQGEKVQGGPVTLIPKPMQMQRTDGVFVLKSNTVILVEQKAGGFKLSFRSRCELDCSHIAEQFGGGGHKAAAGASVEGGFETVQPHVLDVVRAAMR